MKRLSFSLGCLPAHKNFIYNESMGGLDDLMMGNVSEDVSETDEQITARIVAAQQRIAAIRKDEKKASIFDKKLAKILPSLSTNLLNFVIFLINNEVPSLTILALISLASNPAGKICYDEFHKYIAEPADFSLAKIENPQVEERISLWWTFIFAADHVSKTTKLHDFRKKDEFIRRISKQFSEMLKTYLIENKIEKFNDKILKKLLKKYADAAFSHNPLDQEV